MRARPVLNRFEWQVPTPVGVRTVRLERAFLSPSLAVAVEGRTIARVHIPKPWQPPVEATVDIDGVAVLVRLTARVVGGRATLSPELFVDGASLADGRLLDEARAATPPPADRFELDATAMEATIRLVGWHRVGGAGSRVPLWPRLFWILVPASIAAAVMAPRNELGAMTSPISIAAVTFLVGFLPLYWLVAAPLRLLGWLRRTPALTYGLRASILLGFLLLECALVFAIPMGSIAWGRAHRSGSAPAHPTQTLLQADGRWAVGTYEFTVGGVTYRDRDAYPTDPETARRWTAAELPTLQVCYDPARPGDDSAIAPARYRCGDPEIATTDGGW